MDESRKQFDEAYQRMQYDHFGSNRDFAWKFWQASRAAIEIKLPAKIEREVRDTDIDDERRWGHNDAIRDCAEAIRAAGIKVKEGV
ncbi:TPA_asm: hypothetical protein G4I96_000633 [Salmonella enterica subsp. diarizonae serovar 50:l,v:z35]|nr:hypothetical protein [Salmonella enterica subsp. diarizonae serovar 50:l,v:z35]